MIEAREIPIDQNNIALKQYEDSFKRGLESLSKEQKEKFFRDIAKPDITNKDLLNALNKANNPFVKLFRNIVKNFTLD